MPIAWQVGQAAVVSRVFCQQDLDRFAALSGDDNPIHVDPQFSARTAFGRTVAHGMLLYGAVSAALGTLLPGPGTWQLEQELMFPSPTYTGEQVTIQLGITDLQPADGLAELATVLTRPDGNVGLQGRSLVRLPGSGMGPPSSWQLPRPPARPTEAAVFRGLEVGQRAVIRRSFTSQDLAEYVDLTGDSNPLFADARYARQLGLNGPTIPGSLLGGLFSYLLGTRLPGRGTNYLKQRLAFPQPAYPGQEITAEVEVVRLRPHKELVNLSTVCTNPAGESVCEGEALVLVRDLEAR